MTSEPPVSAVKTRLMCAVGMLIFAMAALHANADTTLSVGVYENPPLLFSSHDGGAQGFFADVLADIADREGWSIEYRAGSWSDSLGWLEEGTIDLLGAIAYSAERETLFRFNDETVIVNWGQVYAARSSDIESFPDLDGRRLAVLNGDIYEAAFLELGRQFGITTQTVAVGSYDEVLNLIVRGEVDAGIVNRFFAMRHASDAQVRPTPIVFNPVEIRFAAPYGNGEALLATVDRYLKEMKETPGSVYYRGLDRWFGGNRGEQVPPGWVKWVLGSALGLLTLALAGDAVLRGRVRARTKALEAETTRHRATADALAKSEEQIRAVLNSIGDAVIAADLRGYITGMNPVAETLCGVSAADSIGSPLARVWQIVNENTGESAGDPVAAAISGDRNACVTEHCAIVSRDGTEHPVAISLSTIRSADGEVTGIVLVFRDVTVERRLEQERLRMEKLKSLGVLAGGIAHDFNNLLTGLYGNLELAKTGLPEHDARSGYLDAALKSMDRAVGLTKQLLTFARGGNPVTEPLDVTPVLVETPEFVLRGSRVKLVTRITTELWLVDADKGQLENVIANLVINAKQAMASGGTVTIAATNHSDPDGRFVSIAVSDNGPGIPPEHLERVFDPYFTTRQNGSGLGLTSAFSIVAKHGGTLTVASEPGKGSVFTIRLPASDQSQAKTDESPAGGTTKPNARILVLDDEEAVRTVSRLMMEQLGYRVTTAADGNETVAIYRSALERGEPFDAVIVDLTIPGDRGGVAVAREIWSMRPEARVIVASGYASDPVLAEYREHGFRARIAKPFQISDVRAALSEALRG